MSGENPRVLLVGNNTSDELRIGRILAKELGPGGGVEVVAGFSGAREHLSARPVDIVFLLLGQPEDPWMEGFSSLRGDRPAVPMVVLTGNRSGLSARKARELGADYSIPTNGLQGPTLRQIAHYAMEHRRLVNDLDGQKSKVQEYTGRIAHSLNNELSTILLHADLMKVTMETGAPMEAEDVSAVNESARRAAKLTKDLLGFSRQARR